MGIMIECSKTEPSNDDLAGVRVPGRLVLTIELRGGVVSARINTCASPLSRDEALGLAKAMLNVMDG
ncbi:MAG: hypothetical protein Q6365_006795 [Candidatus Sigynarchaeota archaeon]